MATGNGDVESLINQAIDTSIKFEELMDSTDFGSWLEKIDEETVETDKKENLDTDCDKHAFKRYKENTIKAKDICTQFILSDFKNQ